ncbi:hypothetical protein OF83DRAFT_1065353 [Amylostereum chailletii]|nr:hypothetical protein OF83DRAFT_1065353 [Amylostereum chailletii]
MLKYGSVAVAIVNRQVVVVQAVRPHDHKDRYVDVYTFAPLSRGVFLAAAAPCARIPSKDILTIFPSADIFLMPARDVLELPASAYEEFRDLSARMKRRPDNLWMAWKSKFC